MWLESLLEMNDPSFLRALDVETNPAHLAIFAGRWYADPRPHARELLHIYLAGSLHPCHESLVMALLDLASRAGDDEVMGEFFLIADRSLLPHLTGDDRWTLQPTGFERGEMIGDAFLLYAWPGSRVLQLSPEQARAYQNRKLFGEVSRLQLRRKVWEYFDRLGRAHPRRYVEAMKRVLCRSVEADVGATPNLLSKWCLCHVLIGNDAILRPDAEGRCWEGSGAERAFLDPHPAHEQAWADAPELLLAVMKEAASRKIQDWARKVLCRQSAGVLRRLPVDDLISLVTKGPQGHISAAVDVLRQRGGWGDLGGERWLTQLLSLHEQQQIVTFVRSYRPPLESIKVEEALKLATANSPAAVIGWKYYLVPRLERGEDLPLDVLFRLLDAPRDGLRERMARKVREELSIRMPFEPDWVLRFLDHRRRDIRLIGWEWFNNDVRLRDDTRLWFLMARASQDDIRSWLLSRLLVFQQEHPSHLRDALPMDASAIRVLWARVLLTLHGPWKRTTSSMVRLLIARLEWRPNEAPALWPILAEVLRVAKGPPWREALAGAVRLLETHPEWRTLASEAIPDLRLGVAAEPAAGTVEVEAPAVF